MVCYRRVHILEILGPASDVEVAFPLTISTQKDQCKNNALVQDFRKKLAIGWKLFQSRKVKAYATRRSLSAECVGYRSFGWHFQIQPGLGSVLLYFPHLISTQQTIHPLALERQDNYFVSGKQGYCTTIRFCPRVVGTMYQQAHGLGLK